MTNKISIKLKISSQSRDLPMPKYETLGSAGMDLMASIDESIILSPGERKLIPTGLSIALPVGYEAQVRPRSGLAIKHGMTVLNTPGTIDSDYRGEIMVILANLSDVEFKIERGMRIAQIVFAPVTRGEFSVVDNLDSTTRGEKGFGSTGI
ncbi:MAG: dUTP diphosphatase [Rickettsiales bacterium]